jgi:thioredoxin-related protein
VRRALAVVGLVMMLSAPATLSFAGVRPPLLAERSLNDLRLPLPYPYDETSGRDADRDIDAAFARARVSHKRILVHFGGNWCSWCRILAGVMALQDAKSFVDQHFEVVTVSITPTRGRVDHNLQALRRFHLAEPQGFPYLVIADAGGRVLARSYAVTDENHQTPQAMINWLAERAQ